MLGVLHVLGHYLLLDLLPATSLILLENVGAIGRLIMHGFIGGTLLNWIRGLDH